MATSRRARIWRALATTLAVLQVLLALGPGIAVAASPELVAAVPPASGTDLNQASCAPRPPVQVQNTKIGEKDFQVTLTAGRGNLQLVRFAAAPNALLDLPGRPPGQTPPLEVKPPVAPTYTFVLRANNVGATVTLPITVFDECGSAYPWSTFIGSGTAATKVPVSISDASIVEGDSGTQGMAFVVTLGWPASVPVTVGWSTGASASAGPSDYVSASGVLTFVPGETQKTIVIQVVGDQANEPTKSFTVELANATNATIARGTATGTIVDNDGAPSLSVNDVAIQEGDSGSQGLQFTVTLSSPSGQSVSVQYATQNDTATAGSDYDQTSGQLQFGPGDTTRTVTVQVKGDTITEPDERFFVKLTNPTNAAIVRDRGTGTIGNDDATPTIELKLTGSPFAENGGVATVSATLSHQTTLPVSIDLGFAGTAVGGTDYTASAFQIGIPALGTNGSITLTGVPDAIFEGNETVEVAVIGATNAIEATPQIVTGTIAEDDAQPTVSWTSAAQTVSESVGTVTVAAQLSAVAGLAVTVPFTLGGTATQGVGQDYTVSPTTITIPVGQTSASTTVTVNDDSAGEPAETITLTITGPTNATVGATPTHTITVNDNDGPVVTTTSGATAFTENGAAVTVDGSVTVASPGVNLVSASVVISNPLDGASESLASTAAPVVGITSSYDAPSHTLSFTGTGTAAQYQGLLQGVKYADTSDNPTTTARTITFQVTSSVLPSNVASKSVTIGATNDAPTLTGIEGAPLPYAENDPPKQITNGILVADLDNANLASATVKITGNCASGEDVLALVPNPQNGITGSYAAGTCTLTLSGSASLTSYQAALRAVQYSNSSNNPSTLARTVSFTVNDGTVDSAAVTRSITVGSSNDAPVVTASGALAPTFSEGGPAVVVDGAITVTDADNANLASATIALTANPDGLAEGLDADLTGLAGISKSGAGTATLTLTGPSATASFQTALQRVKYTNSSVAPTTTDRTVTFKVNDGTVDSNVPSATVHVAAVNTAPVLNATSGGVTFTENGSAVAVDAAITITDPDNATLASATVVITNVQDGASESLDTDLTGLSGISKSTSTAAGTFTLSLTQTSPGSASKADLQTALQRVKYTNASNTPTTSPDRIVSFKVNDGAADSNVPTRTVTVVAANDAPTAVADGYSTDEDSPLTVDATLGVLANDTDPDTVHTALTAVLVTGPSSASSFTLNANGSFSYTPNGSFSGSDSFTYKANDGALDSNTVTVSIAVNAVDDAPVNTLPSAPTVNQNSVLTLSGAGAISIADVDAGSNAVQVTLTATNGTMTLNGTAGLSFTAGDGTSDATMTFTGTITNINTALNGMTFTPTSGYSGAASIQIVTDDQGFTGVGGPLSDTDTLSITVQAQNQPPVNGVPGAQSVNEDATLTFSSGTSNLISISDPDAGGASVKVTLTATNGTLSLNGTAGLSFTVGDGTSDGTMTFTGTITAINTALNGMTFTPTGNYSGPATLQVTTDDQGNTGPGGAKSDTDSVSITVNPVNDAPSIARPATISVNEDTTFTFSAGNVISIADIDAGSGSLTVTLSVTSGTLTLSGIGSLSFAAGDGTADASMTFSGTLTNINTALNGMTYRGNANFSGTDTLSIGVDDNGNTGGGSQTDSKSVNITVAAQNDAPVNTVPGTQTFNEDSTLTFSTGNGNAISIADVDVGAGTLTVTLSTTAGTLAFGSITNLTGVTNNAATIVATGTVANLNAGLQGTVYTPTLNLNGAQTISMQTSDNGNTGAGGAQSDNDTINLSITAVNDAPSIARPATITVNEDQPFTFNAGNPVSVADVDAGTVQVTLTATHGTLTLSGTSGLSFAFSDANGTGAGDGTADATMTFRGTVTNVNAALNGMTYQGVANYNGADTLSIGVNDLGNTGSGGPLTDSKSVGITVTPVNDAPTANAFASQPAQASIKITYPAGKLGGTDVEDGTSVTIDTTPGTVTNGTVVIRADGGFDFTPDPDSVGAGGASFTYRVTDSGVDSTVSGAPLNSAYVTVSFTVAGPEMYIVKTVAAGSGNCTLTNECTLATALTNIGARTNVRIFINDSGNHNTAVPLTSGSWLIGQGVTTPGGVTFDSLFGISAPAQGTLATRPSLGGSRPTVQQTTTLNTNSAVRGLNLSTGGSTGMTDPGAAITGVNVSEVSVTTGTGTAVLLSGTGGTLSFTAVSSNGAASGISLSNTTGSFTVTGTGTSNSGGTIQGSTGDGISLSTAQGVSLNWMTITSSNNNGIFGDNVTDFTIANSSVTNNDAANAVAGAAGLRFNNLLGTCAITNTTISGTKGDNVRLTPSSGTLTNLTISGSTIGPNPVGTGANGIAVLATGTANLTITVTGSTIIAGNQASGFLTTITNTAVAAININNSDFHDNNINVDLGSSLTGSQTIDVHDNTILRAITNSVNIVGDGQINGTINQNIIGNGTADSGSRDAYDIGVSHRSNLNWKLAITNNTVKNSDFEGIFVRSGDVSGNTGRLDLTVTGNTVSPPDDNSGFPASPRGMHIRSRQATTLCANIANNEAQGKNGGVGYHLQESDTSVLLLQGFTTDGATTIAAKGNKTNGVAPTTDTSGEPFGGGCTAQLP